MVTTSYFKRLILAALCACISFQAQAGLWNVCTSYAHQTLNFLKQHKTALAGLVASGVAAAFFFKPKKDILIFNEMPRLKQFIVTPQSGTACGYHAVANAWAIQETIKNNLPLVPSNINDKAAFSFANREDDNELSVNEVLDRVNLRDYKTNQVYVLKFDHESNSVSVAESVSELLDTMTNSALDINNVEREKGVTQLLDNDSNQYAERETAYNTLIEKYKKDTNNVPSVTHFICLSKFNNSKDSVMNHWVVISIVKDQKNSLSMIYCDSLNTSLDDSPIRYAMVKKLYEVIFHVKVSGISLLSKIKREARSVMAMCKNEIDGCIAMLKECK